MNLNQLIGRVEALERELAEFRAAHEGPPDRRAEPVGGGGGISNWGLVRSIPAMELADTRKLSVTLARQRTVRAGGAPIAGTIASVQDEDTADVTLPDDPAHGITVDDRVNVVWDGGHRYDMAVTAAAAGEITVEGGGGDELLEAGPAVTVQARAIKKWYLLTNDTVLRTTEPDLNAQDYTDVFWPGPADLDPEEDFPFLIETNETNGVMYLLPIFGTGEGGVILSHLKMQVPDEVPPSGWPVTDAVMSAAGGALVRLTEP